MSEWGMEPRIVRSQTIVLLSFSRNQLKWSSLSRAISPYKQWNVVKCVNIRDMTSDGQLHDDVDGQLHDDVDGQLHDGQCGVA